VQAYKHWFIDLSLEDSFESLIGWVEFHLEIREEAKKETSGLEKMKSDNQKDKK